MIVFQFRSGVWQYFHDKYIIISQRVRSWQTERAAGPSLFVKATGKVGSSDWVDATNVLIKYNSVTGRNALCANDFRPGNRNTPQVERPVKEKQIKLGFKVTI